ncbi:exocyst complex component 6B [Pungitius pungitius]|uniref:exocyst complex component 6B n=1 Tax=Pungitius pungitius TaxID=134920 RepID=UPI002E11E790
MASVETAAEHERILREIESTDTNCIGPTLRSVYDGQEHGPLHGEPRRADQEPRPRDREDVQPPLPGLRGLHHGAAQVRGEAQKLKSQVTETNQRLQDDGKELMGSMEELQKCRLQQRNIASTIDKLSHCLPVLEMYSRLQEQMSAKGQFPILLSGLNLCPCPNLT